MVGRKRECGRSCRDSQLASELEGMRLAAEFKRLGLAAELVAV